MRVITGHRSRRVEGAVIGENMLEEYVALLTTDRERAEPDRED